MKKQILCIDDEADIRQLLEEALTLRGYRVKTAAEPQAAKKSVREDPPDLIVMDFQIEEGDGFTLIEDIRKLGPGIPILLLTGAVFDRAMVREAIEKKVSRYLDKTASLSEIISEIEKLLVDAPKA
ncbi:MAG TPA: response regulator [Candidatus Baltobacteraceae bacterium]|jgi:DNA-binding NtrC family response regulator|nr:response regulator [Candidatus Baltobacteraceae bacterium]